MSLQFGRLMGELALPLVPSQKIGVVVDEGNTYSEVCRPNYLNSHCIYVCSPVYDQQLTSAIKYHCMHTE